MAAYGTLVAWAQALGHTEAAGSCSDLMQRSRRQEAVGLAKAASIGAPRRRTLKVTRKPVGAGARPRQTSSRNPAR